MCHKYELGKCDYNTSGRKNCRAVIEWKLKDGRFSMTATIWQPNGRDILCGGQCVDTVVSFFPDDKKAQRMAEIWKRWHLNDMCAGSPAQSEYLRQHPIDDWLHWHEKACEALRHAGLNPDPNYLHEGKPYVYGRAWLKEDIPPDVIAEIESW